MRENCFDFLRLFAAVLVLVGHGFVLMGKAVPVLLGTPISSYGVIIFFSLSGYLISGSWMSDPHPGRYFLRRGLRIFPALAVVVLLTAFIAGPVLSELPSAKYFANFHTFDYLTNIALYITYFLPGVFQHNPYPVAVNGSLWSLPAEFFMYLLTPWVFVLLSRRSAIAFAIMTVLFACGSVYLSWYWNGPRIVVYRTDVASLCAMACYFTCGALLQVLGPRFAPQPAIAVGALAGYALFAHYAGPALRFPVAVAGAFALPYAVLALGRRALPVLCKAGAHGDFSYGIYLYAFPVQQTIAALFPALSVPTAIVLALVVSLVFAATSWHFIEAPALRLKPLRQSVCVMPVAATAPAE